MRLPCVLVLFAHATVLTASTSAQPAKAPRLDFHGDPLPEGAVARLGTVRFQPPGRLVAFTPDGSALAVAAPGVEGRGTRIVFLDAVTGKPLRQLDLGEYLANGFLRFTPDGKHFLIYGWSGLCRYDTATGKRTQILKEEIVSGAYALSPDSKYFAYQPLKYVKDAPVRLWDTVTKKDAAELPGRGVACRGLRFSANGKRLLLWSNRPTSVTEKTIRYENGYRAALACIDIDAGKIVGETTAEPGQEVALCPDGETIALADAKQQSVRVIHLPSGAVVCTVPAQSTKFDFSPDGKMLLTIDQAGQAALWDAAKGSKIRDLDGGGIRKDNHIVGFSADGKTIAVLDGYHRSLSTLVVWDAATGMRAGRPPVHHEAVTCLGYAPGGKLLASGSLDKTVRLWNPVTGEHLRLLAEHKDEITAVAFSLDGKLVVSSSRDGAMRLTFAADGKAVATFAGPEKGAEALAFTPDGKVMFASGHPSEVLAWEVANGKEVVRLKTGDDDSVMAFSTGGAMALTASNKIRATETEPRLQMWNLMKKQPVADIPLTDDHFDLIRCEAARFSPDGRLMASQVTLFHGPNPAHGEGQLRIWERASGQPILKLGPTATRVQAFSPNGRVLAFSPNGRLLAFGGVWPLVHLDISDDNSDRLDIWDAVTGKKVARLPVSPLCLAFSPQGSHLATGGNDQSVLIWEAPRLQPQKQPKGPSAQQREAWWNALGDKAEIAYQAIGHLLDAPDAAVTLLKERVQPVKAQDPDAVTKLIKLLDHPKFAEREKAHAALASMGDGAAGTLQAALDGKWKLETRRRLEALLLLCDATSPTSLQHDRAVATLAWIDTPAARALLQEWADGAPAARLTVAARYALNRLH